MWFFKEGYWKIALITGAVVSLLWLMIPHANNMWLWGVEETAQVSIVIPDKVQTLPVKKDVVLVRKFFHESQGIIFPMEVWYEERNRAIYILMLHPNLPETTIMVSVAYEGMKPYVIWVNENIEDYEFDLFPQATPQNWIKSMYREDM